MRASQALGEAKHVDCAVDRRFRGLDRVVLIVDAGEAGHAKL